MTGSPDLMEGMSGLDAESTHYAELLQYHSGELPERFASERIRKLIESSARDYRFRLSRVPIEALANRVGISSITSSRGDAVNAKIEEIRQANDMELQEPFIHERMFIFGDAYLLVWPIEAEDMLDADSPKDADTVATGVEFAYQSPLSCRTFYDAEDGRNARFTIRRWKEKSAIGAFVWRAEVWYWDRLESWVTLPDRKGTDIEDWIPYAEDAFGITVPATPENWPEMHDFGEIPIKHARSDLPYGRSEIEDFIGAQNILTKATATQSSGIESHGWRERYRVADDKAILDQASDVVPWGDDADARAATANGRVNTPESGRRSGPGTEQTFHGTKAVGEFSATDLGSFEAPIDQWLRLGAAASGTPYAEFDPRFGAQMSGVAYDRMDRPMKKKEADRKRFLLRFWREAYGLALAIVGIRDFGDLTVNWAPPEVISDPDWWTVATARRDHGVPQKTILLEANYTAEDIQKWEDEKDDDAETLDRAISRIGLLGDAMQKLGAGATLLGIPPDRIATLVESLLSEAGSPGKLVLEKKEPLELEGGENDDETDESEEPGNGDGPIPGR
jgi:hypothetical protein